MIALAADPTIRRQVLASARRVLARDAAAPIADIVRDAGVSRATFYRHFGSRDALLEAVDHERPPDARTRVLEAAVEMLTRTSLAELEMDALARAAGVSRGTLYRLVPGKPALLGALVEAYSPFRPVLALMDEHREDPPEVVLPLIARRVGEIATRRFGLLRAILHEATLASPTAVAGVGPIMQRALGTLAAYLAAQMAAGRIRRMHPLLALQAFMGPIYFHLMTRPLAENVMGMAVGTDEAIEELVEVILAGLRPDATAP